MIRDQVKARKVGDSIIITLTKPITEEFGIVEGDSLVLETISDTRVIISKEVIPVSILQKVELELDILYRRKFALEAEVELAMNEYHNSMPTVHPGIEDPQLFEGTMKQFNWEHAKLEQAIAEKRLELFELGGNDCQS